MKYACPEHGRQFWARIHIHGPENSGYWCLECTRQLEPQETRETPIHKRSLDRIKEGERRDRERSKG